MLSNLNGRLLCTMPRSGTWYAHYFFAIYDALQRDQEGFHLPLRNFAAYDGIGINLGVVHAICPGFQSLDLGEMARPWHRLRFASTGYDWGSQIAVANPDLFFPQYNRDARIVHLVRNPLDQCVSFFHHAANHVAAELRGLTRDADGTPRPLRAFLLNEGIDSFIKQHVTFQRMAAAFPDNVLVVAYEDLMAAPAAAFARILAFFGHEAAAEDARLVRAVALCAPERLRRIEHRFGSPLAGDQLPGSGSHIRSGRTGDWRAHLQPGDLDRIQTRMGEFGLDLGQFRIEDGTAVAG